MTEHHMEDLIAQFPDDFFHGNGLVLKGRQQSFAEVGRFDLLFVDSFGTNVLIELKARTAKYEDASQLAKYKDALHQRGEQNILMWLVAPQIPNSVREFLDRIGIEYTEIHPAQYQLVAERHGVKIESEASEPVAVPHDGGRSGSSSRVRVTHSQMSLADYPYRLNEDFDRNQLNQYLRTFDSVVKREIDRSISEKLRHELLDSNPPSISRSTTGQLAKWCNTNSPLYWDGMDVARSISQLLFGCVLDRNKLGA